jgi:hypothetical protein
LPEFVSEMTSVLTEGTELRRREGLDDISKSAHHEGIYTHGREWEPDTHDIFLGVDADKFYKVTTRRFTAAANAVETGCSAIARYLVTPAAHALATAYAATAKFAWNIAAGKRWYVMAVPAALLLSAGMYAGVMKVEPHDVQLTDDLTVRKRKKTHLDYWMKYLNQGKQKVREITGNDDSLENKIEPK